MSASCRNDNPSCDVPSARQPAPPVEAPAVLREIARRHGTPTFAYDLGRIRAQVDQLRTHLPASVEVLYSLKANPSLGLCGVLARCGLGADVASAGELVTALAAGFPPGRIVLTGPDRSPAVLAGLASLPDVVVSVDSASELRQLAAHEYPRLALLRLRPDFCSYATCSAGPDSRFGLTADDLPGCRPYLAGHGARVIGFHVFAGSQVLSAEGIIHHLRGAIDLARRAADVLAIAPEIIDIGGGFGVPYGPDDQELDLAAVGRELAALAARAAPARLVIELGRYLVAPSGWYLTTVLAEQTYVGRKAVVVDGGTHQRGDLCGVGLRRKGFAPAVLAPRDGAAMPTDVLGCLSLPADVLLEAAPLPPLAPGAVLAFPNAGAYGLGASPWSFHGHPAPAEVAFDGERLQPLRVRRPPSSVLDDQVRLEQM
jgi:diaminopimelate decarboxylase